MFRFGKYRFQKGAHIGGLLHTCMVRSPLNSVQHCLQHFPIYRRVKWKLCGWKWVLQVMPKFKAHSATTRMDLCRDPSQVSSMDLSSLLQDEMMPKPALLECQMHIASRQEAQCAGSLDRLLDRLLDFFESQFTYLWSSHTDKCWWKCLVWTINWMKITSRILSKF